jgi:septation ring formation regulator EzrA
MPGDATTALLDSQLGNQDARIQWLTESHTEVKAQLAAQTVQLAYLAKTLEKGLSDVAQTLKQMTVSMDSGENKLVTIDQRLASVEKTHGNLKKVLLGLTSFVLTAVIGPLVLHKLGLK